MNFFSSINDTIAFRQDIKSDIQPKSSHCRVLAGYRFLLVYDNGRECRIKFIITHFPLLDK